MSKIHEKKPKVRDSVEVQIGYRLEAKDLSGNWFPAKVVDINESKKKLLIHFDRWNSKFDEWLSMSSDRIRSVQKPEPKAEKRFVAGDRVLAVWSVYQKYPATVQKVLPHGKYKVVFDDGYSKVLVASKMWPHDEPSGSGGPGGVYAPPIGSKQDRRDRKRKIIVSDLFRSNKRPRLSDSASPSPAPPVETIVKEPKERVEAQPVPNSTLPVHVVDPDGTEQVWQKYLVARAEGKTAGKNDIVIANPDGRKFRTKVDVVGFLDSNKLKYNLEDFHFSTTQHRLALNNVRLSKKSAIKDSKPAEPPAAPGAPLEAAAKEKGTPATPVAAEKEKIMPAHAPQVTPAPATPTAAVSDAAEDVVVVAGMEVMMLDGQLICPDNSCRKHFRKESLLQMHLKHYHPKMSKLLDYTPSVTELAYARHVSGFSPTTPENRQPRLSYPREVPMPAVDSKATPEPPAAVPPPPPPAACSSVDQVSTPVAALPPRPTTPAVASPPPPPLRLPPPADTPTSTPPSLRTLLVKAHKLENLATTTAVSCPPIDDDADFEKSIRCNIICRTPTRESVDGEGSKASCSTVVGSNPILNTLLKAAPAATPAEVPEGTHWPTASTSKEPVADSGAAAAAGEDAQQEALVDVESNDKKYEKLKNYELINCICLLKEEDGMMIQCEVCLCWQHGLCLGIEREDQVPDAYMCPTCQNPLKGRSSAKYFNHQLWLKKGRLPTLDEKEDDAKRLKRQELLKRAYDTSGQLVLLSRVLHSFNVKLSIADNKNHHKLYLWINKWHSALSPSSSPKQEPGTEPGILPKIQPEKAFNPLECKMHLLEHIESMQDQVQERLDRLEAQIDELEKLEDEDKDSSRLQLQEASESNSCLVKTSATIKMLLRDLATVQNLSYL